MNYWLLNLILVGVSRPNHGPNLTNVIYGRFDSRFDSKSNRYSRFDSYSIRTQTADSQVLMQDWLYGLPGLFTDTSEHVSVSIVSRCGQQLHALECGCEKDLSLGVKRFTFGSATLYQRTVVSTSASVTACFEMLLRFAERWKKAAISLTTPWQFRILGISQDREIVRLRPGVKVGRH